jgi:hypothetical protein
VVCKLEILEITPKKLIFRQLTKVERLQIINFYVYGRQTDRNPLAILNCRDFVRRHRKFRFKTTFLTTSELLAHFMVAEVTRCFIKS